MTTDLDVRQPSAALAIRPGQEMWTDKQKSALAVLGIRNATNADLAVFMHYCQKTGLDPFSRQIYMICRREKQGNDWVDKQTIQVGIDGFRVIRDRIAQRLGISVEYEDTIWYDDDGSAWNMWLWDRPPAACKVTIIKDGKRFPAVVRTAAYAATNKDGQLIAQWRTQPEHMIEKCAEAFALRRAFPHDLGGVYLEDEMPPAPPQVVTRSERVTVAEITGETNGRTSPADDPGPAALAEHETPVSGPAAGSGTTSPQPASKAALERLNRLIAQLGGLGPDEDVRALWEWLTGEPWAATRSQVDQAHKWLQSHLDAATGDIVKAANQAWDQYHQANPQAGDDSA